MANSRRLRIEREHFGTTYIFHVTVNDGEDTLTVDDITVKGTSIIAVFDAELMRAARVEFFDQFIMRAA